MNYLEPADANRIIAAAGKRGRRRHRDRVLLQVIYRHGLRCSEAIKLRWADIDLDKATLLVKRLKGGRTGIHVLEKDEVRALRKLKLDTNSPHLFVTELGGPMSPDTVARIVHEAGSAAGLGHVHPHQLRHSTGYMLINDGLDVQTVAEFLGHRCIASTIVYTEISPSLNRCADTAGKQMVRSQLISKSAAKRHY